MSDTHSDGNRSRIDRRKFMAGVGVSAAAGVAGCSDGGDGGDGGTPTGDDGDGGDGGTDTATETEQIVRGGFPVAAASEPPSSFNPLHSGASGSFEPYEWVYTYGVALHPESAKYLPWGFSDWTLEEGNVGSDSPTITATVRDGLTFNDGEELTAEDVSFTYNYMLENEPGGQAPGVGVESVEVDSDDGSVVNFYMSQELATWIADVLGFYFLPQHIWKDVADFSQYKPRDAEEGVVASGPLELTDFSWEQWYEFEMRDDSEFPDWNGMDTYPWLHPEGPFVDGVRYEMFRSASALFQAMFDGTVHMSARAATLEQAIQVQDDPGLENKEIVDSDFLFYSYNTRRVPLDDKAFRQFLSKMFNYRWLIEEQFQGIGALKNRYATSTMYDEWRPPEPEETDSFEGIELPDLAYPSDTTEWGESIPQEDIDALREFLINHPEAKHDYSLGEAQSDHVSSPDGQAIYVNGQPLEEAHTNNAGEAGHGPLKMSMGPPESEALEYDENDNFVISLNRIGVPVERDLMPWRSQYPVVYFREEYDMHEQSWSNSLVWTQPHVYEFFHSSNADMDASDDKTRYWNSMGYAGADEYLSEANRYMDHEQRKMPIKKALAQIYQDAPYTVRSTWNNFIPVSREYTGYVASNPDLVIQSTFTPLNVRKNPDFEG